MKRNKKGSIIDLVYVGIILFSLSVMVLFGYLITDRFNTSIQANADVDANGKAASTALLAHYPGIIDNSFLLLTIGLCIVTLVLAALVRVHPIFLVLYIIALAFIIIICAALSNVYEEMSLNPELSSLAANMTFMNAVMTWLPLIIGVFGSLLAIVMYKSWREGTSYG